MKKWEIVENLLLKLSSLILMKIGRWTFGHLDFQSWVNAEHRCFPRYVCFLENVSFLCVTVQVFRAHRSSWHNTTAWQRSQNSVARSHNHFIIVHCFVNQAFRQGPAPCDMESPMTVSWVGLRVGDGSSTWCLTRDTCPPGSPWASPLAFPAGWSGCLLRGSSLPEGRNGDC